MIPDLNALRRFTPLVVLVLVVGLGWAILVRPISAERARAERQLDGLRQRETLLRRLLGEGSPHIATSDPMRAFERQVASGDSSPALLEQLARLALTARVRNLLIETVEGGSAAAAASPSRASQPDPRFGLFDARVSYVPIRVAFETDYAGLGRFLWAFRDLPTTVEIRALSLVQPAAENGREPVSAPAGTLRVSMSLYAVLASEYPDSGFGTRDSECGGASVKLGKPHLIASLAMVVASIAYNVWVFTRPATRSGSVAAATQAPIVDGVQSGGPVVTGEQAAAAIDPTTLPPPPDVEIERVPEWPRNPFLSSRLRRPEVVIAGPASEPAVEPDVAVASILHSADRTLALVNGRIVRVGDRVGPNTIIEIRTRAIVVESPRGGRRTIELRMPLTSRGPK